MKVTDCLTGLDTTIDDLQSGVDAGSREAGHIQRASTAIDGLQITSLKLAHLIGTLVWHTRELQTCVRDQRAALQEMRSSIVRLRNELARARSAIRSPLADAADRSRRDD